jgi:hypothetical protein
MAVNIPGGIEPKHLADIRKIMEELLRFLNEKFEVMQINLRLNRSGTVDRLPYFIDWVGVKEVLNILKRDERELDPGLFRFGDDTPSEVNREALDGAPNTIIERNWKIRGIAEKRPGSKVLAQKAHVMYQKVIGIIAVDKTINLKRCVGTFTAGLRERPDDTTQLDQELKKIAGWTLPPDSPLVKWIEDNLVLGGPIKDKLP